MQAFAYNPDAGNETLEDFNGRLRAYCQEVAVLDVTVSTAGPAILLSLTTQEDDAAISPLLLIPLVVALPPAALVNLENVVDEVLEGLKAQDTEENPFLPFQVKLYPSGRDISYAVVLVAAGVLEEDPDAKSEGDE